MMRVIMAIRLGLTSAALDDASVDLTPPGQTDRNVNRGTLNILLKLGPSRHANTSVRRYQEYEPTPCKRAHQETVSFLINTLAF